jgi:DNA-binding MarR family transcriptional regulator
MSGNQLDRLAKVLNQVRLLNNEMPIQTLSVLILIANNDKKNKRTTMSYIAKELGFQNATITRNVSNLSDWTYQKKKGLGLVQMEYDPMDQRIKILSLTKKGQVFIDSLKEIL